MEALAIIPFFLVIIIYLAFIGFIVWLGISFIKAQKERNAILKEISSKLDGLKMDKLE